MQSLELLSAYYVQVFALLSYTMNFFSLHLLTASQSKLYPCINLPLYQYSTSVNYKIFYWNIIGFVYLINHVCCVE